MPEEQWYAVVGYRDRVEVLAGDVWRSNPPNYISNEHPDGWIWVKAVRHSEVPNEATAVYKSTLELFPVQEVKDLLENYLEKTDYTVDEDEAEQLEAIDNFLVKQGERSAFEGLTKITTDYGDVGWE